MPSCKPARGLPPPCGPSLRPRPQASYHRGPWRQWRRPRPSVAPPSGCGPSRQRDAGQFHLAEAQRGLEHSLSRPKPTKSKPRTILVGRLDCCTAAQEHLHHHAAVFPHRQLQRRMALAWAACPRPPRLGRPSPRCPSRPYGGSAARRGGGPSPQHPGCLCLSGKGRAQQCCAEDATVCHLFGLGLSQPASPEVDPEPPPPSATAPRCPCSWQRPAAWHLGTKRPALTASPSPPLRHAALLILRPHIRLVLQQQLHHGRLALLRRAVQRRPASAAQRLSREPPGR